MRRIGTCNRGTPCVYEIRNTTKGKVYVGSTSRFAMRFTEHLRLLQGDNHHSRRLQFSYNKHGPSVFEMKVIEVVSHAAFLIAREQRWIDFHGFKNTYNASPVAGGGGKQPNPVWAICPSTGETTEYESVGHAATELIGDVGKEAQIRKAAYSARKCRGLYWSFTPGCSMDTISETRDTKRRDSQKMNVFAFDAFGVMVGAFVTARDAARHYECSESQISLSIRLDRYRTAAGLTWSNDPVFTQTRSRKTKRVVQKQDGRIVKIWDALKDASDAIPGATLKGISSAATGYTKSHRGYQWEFARS